MSIEGRPAIHGGPGDAREGTTTMTGGSIEGESMGELRAVAVGEVLRALRGVKRVILTTHLNADGDGAGSEAALLAALEWEGIEGWIVNPTPFPESFRFLVPDAGRILDASAPEAVRRCREADVCVVLDTGEKSRIGRVKPMVEHLPLIIVDHHPPGDGALEGVSLRDPGASATGELVFDLIEAWGVPLSRPILEGIYVAILTDTGSFRFSNATPRAHRVVAELIARGVRPDELHRRVYGNVPLRRVRLLEATLPTLQVSPEGGVAWMTVPEARYRELGCTSEDLNGLVDIPRELEGVDVGLLFREIESGEVKVSLRSNERVDVNRVARRFDGGGHVRASGAVVGGDLDSVRERVVDAVVEALADGDPPEPASGSGVDG